MGNNNPLKVFISYTHDDESHIERFETHIAPLKNNSLIEIWRDRKISAGKELNETIDYNIEKADIICLFISAKFLSSDACIEEKKKSIEIKKKKGIAVIPIILSACGWLDDKEISSLLVLPTDGKPIVSYLDQNSAWNIVYNGLKKVVEQINKIKQIKIKDTFYSFLMNIELLSKAHPRKEKVILDDAFVYPEIVKYNFFNDHIEFEEKYSSEKLSENLYDFDKILISGENQSGKTTLCKKLFIELRKNNFIPIYISYKFIQIGGKIGNTISKVFKEQYDSIQMDEFDIKRLVLIIDDFHLSKNKEKHIQGFLEYDHLLLTVDDIFSLNIEDEKIIKSFTNFKILEFSASLRNQLIKKWTNLSDQKTGENHSDNEKYQSIDNITELVNNALGKTFTNGIMPSYPFFILSIISIYESWEKPLDEEITSQGYCYQALIYIYLRKQGVKNNEINTYINFLTEFAFWFYKEKKSALSSGELDSFMEYYLNKFNLSIKIETLLMKLQKTQIISLDSLNNYSFSHLYLYYYFIAQYLAKPKDENVKIIENIISNLHKDENAYIAIFITHHSPNAFILNAIIDNALNLFGKFKPTALDKEELSFFDEQVSIIAKAALPLSITSPEKERCERLKSQDIEEQNNTNVDKNGKEEEEENELSIELRRSIKTVEVMGSIIKNRAGSLEKIDLEKIFKEAMNIHLRILTAFFEQIKEKKTQQSLIDFISCSLNKIIEDSPKKPNKEKLEKLSRIIFWNLNFFITFGIIDKIIHSLGSNELTKIIKKVCDDENSPAAFLVKHGILMWYNKNLQIDDIAKRIENKDFSEITKNIAKFLIVNHCSMHKIAYKDRQKIESKLGIPSLKLSKRD